MHYSGPEPPKDRRWLTIVLATWLGGLAVGFGAAYFMWTELAPATPNGQMAGSAPSTVPESATIVPGSATRK